MYNLKITAAVTLFLVLQGCTTVSPGGPSANLTQTGANDPTTSARKVMLGKNVRQPIQLIAEDLVNALTQIPQLGTAGVTIGIQKSRSGFDAAVADQLALRGYQTSQIQQQGSANSIVTSTLQTNSNNRNEVTLVIAINDIAIKRTYEIKGSFVRPVSALFVRGYSPAQIRLDDRIFVANFGRRT